MGSSSIKADGELLIMNRPISVTGEKEEEAIVLPEKGSNCTWVESPGTADFTERETKQQVRAKAIVSARQKAISAVLKNDSPAEFSEFGQDAFKDSKLTDNVLLLTRSGRIMDEKIKEEGIIDTPQCKACKYRVVTQSCIAPPHKNFDKGFQVQLSINRTQFIEGDEAQAIINSTRDSYIYVFSVDLNLNPILVFPNDAVKDNLVRANESFSYPNDAHKKLGIHLVAELPQDAEVSAETLRVIAVPESLKESDIKGTYMQIIERINESETDWVEDAQSFTITKGLKK